MRFEIVSGPERGATFLFHDPARLTLGRGAGCDLALHDEECSRQHAVITRVGEEYWIEDLESKNGTIVNGTRIERHLLRSRDTITLGSTRLRLTELPGTTHTVSGVRVDESSVSQVLVTMDQREADLAGTAPEATPDTDLARENAMLREVCELSQIIAAGNDAEDVLRAIVTKVREVLNADTACLLAPGAQPGAWDVRASSTRQATRHAVSVSRTIVQQAVEQRVAILSKDPSHDERFDPSQSIVLHNISSAICSPLVVEDAAEGVLFIDRRSRRETFNAFDMRIAATATNILALYLHKERLQAEARAKERLAVIGEVIAGLAHFAKNLIMGLEFSLASLRRLCSRRADSADLLAALDAVGFQEKRVSGLIMDMLNYAKDREPVYGELALGTVLEQTVAPYRDHLLDRGVVVDVLCEDDLPEIQAEGRALERVFLNLLTNAIDAVEGREDDGPRRITIAATRVPGQDVVRVRVEDTGTGIPPDKIDRIFTAFFSTKGSRGTGLGLAVVRKIIEEHGGAIEVTSEPGRGTVFTITLPFAPPALGRTGTGSGG